MESGWDFGFGPGDEVEAQVGSPVNQDVPPRERMPQNAPPSPRRGAFSSFRFPPTPPSSSTPFPSRRPGIPLNFASTERTPRSSLDISDMRRQLDRLETGTPAVVESPRIPFQECNILFIIDSRTPLHRGFKSFAQQLLLKRSSPATPAVTRMIFWNEAFNQYVVQEVTTTDGEINCEVADIGPIRDLTRLATLQHRADLIVIYTSKSTASLMSPVSLLSVERSHSHRLQLVPHILVMAHEGMNKPSPKNAFSAARHFANLRNIAVLYQETSSRETLGCHILHIDGCLESLRTRGRFDGNIINSLIEWNDLSQLDLSPAMERLILFRDSPRSALPTDVQSHLQSSDLGVTNRSRRQGFIHSPIASPPAVSEVVSDPDVQRRAANRVRRISALFESTTRDESTLLNLQRELRLEHRRNSRMGMSGWSGGSNTWQQRLPGSVAEELTVASLPPPADNSFRGECQLCCEEDSQLVFLFKQSLHAIPQQASVQWPFAVGSDPENDVISAFMCCDNCCSYVVDQGRTPLREPSTGWFPLVPYSANAEKWKDTLCKGLGHYGVVSRDLLPLVFLAIVEETLYTKSWAKPDGSEENDLRRNALLWTKREILKSVHMKGNGHDGYIGEWIYKVVTNPTRGWGSMVWQYPLPGFVLMLRLAAEHQQEHNGHTVALAKIFWKRMLIEVTRRFKLLLTHGDDSSFETVTSMAMAINEMLLRDTVPEAEWLQFAASEGFLTETSYSTLWKLEEEMSWVQKNCKYATVMWLSWMPGIQGLNGSTCEMVDILVEGGGGQVVMESPEDVGKDWCSEVAGWA